MFAGVKGFFKSAIANAVDAYFNLTTLLLHGDGTNGAQNNTFLDSSSNNFTITRNGNTTQGTFTPFSQTGWSNYFNGGAATDAINTSSAISLTGDFTVECWIYQAAASTSYAVFGGYNAGTVQLCIDNGSTGAVVIYANSTTVSSSAGVFTRNVWNHIAFTRSGSTVKIYLNGSQVATGTISGTISLQNIGSIGANYTLNGYISNFRVTSGAALYTSTFTPSTTPLTTTVSSGTVVLLTCQSNRFVDNSASPNTLTITAAPSVQAFSPFAPTAAYSAATNGGAGYFDGAGDYLSSAANAAYSLGTGDFTLEFWIYFTVAPSTTQLPILTWGDGSYKAIRYTNSVINIESVTGSASFNVSLPSNLQQNTWQHVAIVRSSGIFKVYLNGVGGTANSSYTTAVIGNSTDTIYIGYKTGTGDSIQSSYLSNIRLTKSAVYSANFTPPTAPVTAITNTQLLLNFTNGGIFDQTGKNDLETAGNVQISTSVKKYGSGSIAFDGTGDYAILPNAQQIVGTINGTCTLTIEGWIYHTQRHTSNEPGLIGDMMPTGGTNWWSFGPNASGYLTFYTYPSGTQTATTTQIPLNTWTHIAVSIQNGTIRLFVNGVLQSYTGSATAGSPGSLGYLTLGQWSSSANAFYGYLDDLRITKGYARYTANFTPPTAAFADQ